jgi:tRNA(fMet)-specific endonuclease VapC
LLKLLAFFSAWEVLPFSSAAALECQRLRKERVRIGSQDLKIAAVALVNDALLLSANLADFRKVPRLRVENWLD